MRSQDFIHFFINISYEIFRFKLSLNFGLLNIFCDFILNLLENNIWSF